MLQEALEFVYSAARENANNDKAHIVSLPGSNPRQGWYEHNGTLVPYDIHPGVRCHRVDSVCDIIRAIARWGSDASSVWICSQQVLLILDDADRRDRIAMPLLESATFTRLKKCQGAIDQAALIRLLRVEFRNAVNQPEVLTAVRKIRFRSLSAGETSIQHGNESLGQQVENEVSGAGDIPEVLAVETNVFSNPGEGEYLVTVGLDLEIDAKAQRFMLRPIPDEIERLTAAALSDIRERISEAIDDSRIFFGTP